MNKADTQTSYLKTIEGSKRCLTVLSMGLHVERNICRLFIISAGDVLECTTNGFQRYHAPRGVRSTDSFACFTIYGKYFASESAQLCASFKRLQALQDQAWKRDPNLKHAIPSHEYIFVSSRKHIKKMGTWRWWITPLIPPGHDGGMACKRRVDIVWGNGHGIRSLIPCFYESDNLVFFFFVC